MEKTGPHIVGPAGGTIIPSCRERLVTCLEQGGVGFRGDDFVGVAVMPKSGTRAAAGGARRSMGLLRERHGVCRKSELPRSAKKPSKSAFLPHHAPPQETAADTITVIRGQEQ